MFKTLKSYLTSMRRRPRPMRDPPSYHYIIPTTFNNDKINKNDFISAGITEGNVDELETIKTSKFCRYDNFSILLYENITKIEETHYVIIYLKYNDTITGICIFNILNDEIYIVIFCVPEEYKGYGKILINKIKEISDKKNIKITLSASYKESKMFFMRNGFKITYDGDDVCFMEYIANNISSSGYTRNTSYKQTKKKNKK